MSVGFERGRDCIADGGKLLEKDRLSLSNSTHDDQSLWRRVVELAALISVPPALLYAVGLCTLWIQISQTYWSLNLTTAWYAASLAPKSVALGQGVRAFWAILPVSFLLSFLVMLFVYVYNRFYQKDPTFRGKEPVTFLLGMFTIALLAISFLLTDYSLALLQLLRFLVGFLAFYSLWFLAFRHVGQHRSLTPYPAGMYQLLRYILIGSLLIAVLWPGNLQLPYLVRGLNETGGPYKEDYSPMDDAIEFRITEGRLLTVSGGYWHVLSCGGEYVTIPTGGDTVWFIESDAPPFAESKGVTGDGEVNYCE